MKKQEIISALLDNARDRESMVDPADPDCIFAKDAQAMRAAAEMLQNITSNTKYSGFTDEELYILKRQAIHSAGKILLLETYSNDERTTHMNLSNEIMNEIRRRFKAKEQQKEEQSGRGLFADY